MHYKKSKEILQLIKQAKRILINCHEHPDGDSVGGALAMAKVLRNLNKEVEIICPEDISQELLFLPEVKKIKKVNFAYIDYSKFDFFLIMDTSSWDRVCGNKDLPIPNIEIVNIDHHKSNNAYGEINLIDSTKTSNSEILYSIFEDWGVKVNESIAECLLTGIIADTGSFQFYTAPATLQLAAKLMKSAEDKERISFNLYRNINFENLAVIGELLKNMQLDKKHKFMWSAIPYTFMKDYGMELNLDIIDMLLQSVKGTEFGIRMIEKEPKDLRVSFRGRTKFDTSEIAVALGGGGHPVASGAMIKGMKFEDAVAKVLKTARKYSKS